MTNNAVLNNHDLHELNEALYYMKVMELKNVCEHYGLPKKGNKIALIHRIMTFLKTGNIVDLSPIPDISKARKGEHYPLAANTLMLYGSYKNDAQTRAFFKTLIGNYFHFTAFGVDWLNKHWLAGTPPTYGEFATFWQQEYKLRQQTKVSPKKEWAYINFTQRFLLQNPTASRNEIVNAWEKERQFFVEKVKKLLKLCINH